MRAWLTLVLALVAMIAAPARADELDAWCAQVTLPSSAAICSDPILRQEAVARQKLFETARAKLSAPAYEALTNEQARWANAYTARCGASVNTRPTVKLISPTLLDCYRRESRRFTAYLAKRLGRPDMLPFAGRMSLALSTRLRRGGGTQFDCIPGSCRCRGVDDCLDLIVTTDLCGPDIVCLDNWNGQLTCWCFRK